MTKIDSGPVTDVVYGQAERIRRQQYEAQRTEVATRLLIAAVQDNAQDLNPKQIVQVCVALADELLAELLNPTPRHRQ